MEKLLECFAAMTRRPLGENAVGIYLHGSAVMGCYATGKKMEPCAEAEEFSRKILEEIRQYL